MSNPGGRSRWSLASLSMSLLCGGVIGCASAIAGVSDEVRVLIYDSEAPISIGSTDSKGRAQVVAVADGRLVLDGRAVGSDWVPGGRGPWTVGARRVRGRIAVRVAGNHVQVLNRVGLEAYVASTVGGEMLASWPSEALRAQAVAARTYVLHEAAKRRGEDWDVWATETSQVYRGISAETDETRAAAKSTAGQILTFQGKPILAVFHSTAGGRTATAGEVWGEDLPYLRVVDVEEEDDAPHTYWRTEFSKNALAGVFEAAGIDVGVMTGLVVTRRTPSGRVGQIEVRGSTQAESLGGDRLKTLVGVLGLRSTLFDVRATSDGFAFVGSGHGHGVGMSQWGARALAERGIPYQRILARFYPGTRLEKVKSRKLAAPAFKTRDGRGQFRWPVPKFKVAIAR